MMAAGSRVFLPPLLPRAPVVAMTVLHCVVMDVGGLGVRFNGRPAFRLGASSHSVSGVVGQQRYSWDFSSRVICFCSNSFSSFLRSTSSSMDFSRVSSHTLQLSRQPLTRMPGVGSDDWRTNE